MKMRPFRLWIFTDAENIYVDAVILILILILIYREMSEGWCVFFLEHRTILLQP